VFTCLRLRSVSVADAAAGWHGPVRSRAHMGVAAPLTAAAASSANAPIWVPSDATDA
jgi:hypothetical protein